MKRDKKIDMSANVFEWDEHRPWGRFKILLDLPHTKIKLIEVDPGHRLSYQSHEKREEHWTIVKGGGIVILEGKTFVFRSLEKDPYKLGLRSIEIARKTKHRISNPSVTETLQFIEVQAGEYFGEDDIIRYDDDYGRLSNGSSSELINEKEN